MSGHSDPQGPDWWLANDGRYYPPPPVPPATAQNVVVQNRGTHGLAIASFVLGILWLGWLGSILAVIFGHVALSQIARSGQNGRGLAIVGLVFGWIGVGVLVVAMIGTATVL